MLFLALAFIGKVPTSLTFIASVGAAIVALTVIHKYVFKPIKGQVVKFNRAADAMLGYEPVLDPATGREIQPATPSMANRVKDLEEAHIKIADALVSLADTQAGLVKLDKRMSTLETHLQAHVTESHQWIKEHEALHTLTAEVKAAVKDPSLP